MGSFEFQLPKVNQHEAEPISKTLVFPVFQYLTSATIKNRQVLAAPDKPIPIFTLEWLIRNISMALHCYN